MMLAAIITVVFFETNVSQPVQLPAHDQDTPMTPSR